MVVLVVSVLVSGLRRSELEERQALVKEVELRKAQRDAGLRPADYSRSPTASRASFASENPWRRTILPPRTV